MGVKLIPTDPQAQPILLTCSPQKICLNDKRVSFERMAATAVDIRLFLDQSVVEVFINAQVCLTVVLSAVSPYQIELFAEPASATLHLLEVWEMNNEGVNNASELAV